MTIPGWLIILVLILIGIRQIFRYTRSTHQINKTEKILNELDEIENSLKEHNNEFISESTKEKIINFPDQRSNDK